MSCEDQRCTTVNDFVSDALRDANAIGINDIPSDAELRDGRRKLKQILDSWATRNLNIWQEKRFRLFLSQSAQYALGASGANAFLLDDLSTAVVTARSDTQVETDTGNHDGKWIGYVEDGRRVFMQNTPGAVFSSAVSPGCEVIVANKKIDTPYLLQGDGQYFAGLGDNYPLPIEVISKREYYRYSIGFLHGPVHQIAYDRVKTAMVYPSGVSSLDYVDIGGVFPFAIPSSVDCIDVPDYASLALNLELQKHFAIAYGTQRYNVLARESQAALADLMVFDNQQGNITLKMDMNRE